MFETHQVDSVAGRNDATSNADDSRLRVIVADPQNGRPAPPSAPETAPSSPSLQSAIGELERVFTAATLWFTPRVLPLPVITIQSKGRRAAVGWFWPDRWSIKDRELSPEINICAEHLAGDVLDIAEVLLHEMVHLANFARGIHDCSANQYHNRHFKAVCETIGLDCRRAGWRGWAETSLSPELRKKVEQLHIDAHAFSMFRVDPEGQSGADASQAKDKHRKWSCLCTNVRVAKLDFRARCLKCGAEFRPNGWSASEVVRLISASPAEPI